MYKLGPSEEAFTLRPIQAHSRIRWTRLAPVYMSCMACLSLVIVGAMLVKLYSLPDIGIIIALSSLVVLVFDWMNAALGTDLGLPASVIPRSTFGTTGARFGISMLLVLQGLGWYGVHIAIAARAALIVLETFFPGISVNVLAVFLVTAAIGLLFAFPSITGQRLFIWTNYISAIALLALCIWGTVLGVEYIQKIPPDFFNLIMHPQSGVPLATGTVWLIGNCAAQFVLLSDYARLSRRVRPDSIMLPLVGIIPVGLILYGFGYILGISMIFASDLFTGLLYIGFPFWGLLLIVIAQWNPARVVNLYSTGLALASISGVSSHKARQWFTLLAVILGVAFAMVGILDNLGLFLEVQAFVFPPIGFLYVLDHFVFKCRQWNERKGVNWKAVLSLLSGYLVALLVRHPYSFFLATFVAGALFTLLMVFRSAEFPEKQVRAPYLLPAQSTRLAFCLLGLVGMAVAGIGPLLLSTPGAEIAIATGCILLGGGFYLLTRALKSPAVPREGTPAK